MKSQFIAISRSLINFAEDADDYLWHGIFLASAYFLFGVVQTFQDTHSDHVGHMLGIKIRTSVCGAIYRKVQQQKKTQYHRKLFPNFIVLSYLKSFLGFLFVDG